MYKRSDLMKHQYNCKELCSREFYTDELSFVGSGLQEYRQ